MNHRVDQDNRFMMQREYSIKRELMRKTICYPPSIFPKSQFITTSDKNLYWSMEFLRYNWYVFLTNYVLDDQSNTSNTCKLWIVRDIIYDSSEDISFRSFMWEQTPLHGVSTNQSSTLRLRPWCQVILCLLLFKFYFPNKIQSLYIIALLTYILIDTL